MGNASVAFAITNQIRNEIDDVLAEAPAAAKPSLERVRDIVSAVQVDQTPRVAAAIAYDDEIEAALRRVVPDARIRRDTEWSRDRPDFWVLINDRELRIETKHVGSATSFSGSSLDALFDQMSGSSRLLVITNAVDVSRARDRVAGNLGDRGAVITWRSPADDGELRRGISLLLDPANRPSGGAAG